MTTQEGPTTQEGKTVLLAGASGVLGRHITAALTGAGHTVLSLGRAAGNDVAADLNDHGAAELTEDAPWAPVQRDRRLEEHIAAMRIKEELRGAAADRQPGKAGRPHQPPRCPALVIDPAREARYRRADGHESPRWLPCLDRHRV